MKKLKMFLVVGLILCVAGFAQADLITNGDFATGDLTGWVGWGGGVATGLAGDTTGEGFYAYAGPENGFHQVLPVIAAAGEAYRLTMDVSDVNWGFEAWATVYYVDGGNVVLAEAGTPHSVYAGTPIELAFDITTTPGSVGKEMIVAIYGAAGTVGWGHVDNIQVNAVPEPATMLLLGLGGLFLRRRRA